MLFFSCVDWRWTRTKRKPQFMRGGKIGIGSCYLSAYRLSWLLACWTIQRSLSQLGSRGRQNTQHNTNVSLRTLFKGSNQVMSSGFQGRRHAECLSLSPAVSGGARHRQSWLQGGQRATSPSRAQRGMRTASVMVDILTKKSVFKLESAILNGNVEIDIIKGASHRLTR